MNSKNVLNKILALLSSDDVEMTDAKSANGDILQSPTFDLNEKVDVVSEDGTTSPAPDGEYTISLKDTSGNENIIRIEVKDGKITERANEEEEKNEGEEEMDDADVAMSDAGTADAPTKGDSQNRKDINSVPGSKVADTKQSDIKMANEFPAAPKGASMEPAHALPNTTDEDPRNRIGPDTDDQTDPIISLESMHDRLTKMEDMMSKLAEKFELPINPPSEEANTNIAPSANLPVGGPEMTTMSSDEELPKLDGAPLESGFKFSSDAVHKPINYGKKVGDSQSSFLSKLYS
jgi:hypothetical protein